jgi:hypothetical protein
MRDGKAAQRHALFAAFLPAARASRVATDLRHGIVATSTPRGRAMLVTIYPGANRDEVVTTLRGIASTVHSAATCAVSFMSVTAAAISQEEVYRMIITTRSWV